MLHSCRLPFTTTAMECMEGSNDTRRAGASLLRSHARRKEATTLTSMSRRPQTTTIAAPVGKSSL